MAIRAAFLSALALVVLPACRHADGSRFNPLRDMTTVSEDEERELGLEFDRELRKHVQVIEDPVVAGFINDLGQELVQQIEPQPFVYRFRVVADPSLNAFAVPGGYVYFHSGTILAAGSIDELAGVMGHEIAHVKAHHYARMREKTQIPDLLVGLAGMAAAIATKEPGVAAATQAANVAVKLRFSREFENEADRLGGVFMTRAGYEPDGITRFFERLLLAERQHPHQIPPYLYSHPDVEDRIRSVHQQAESLRATRAPHPRFEAELHEVQGRLAYLLETRRDSVPPPDPPEDPRRLDPYLLQADRLAQEGQVDEALFVLARAEALEPSDPRAPYRIAELLAARGRHREAIAAYRRTVRLDPSRGRVFYRLGQAHEAVGNRHSAVHAYEQASLRAGETSELKKRAEWQIETLIFPVLHEAGFATGEGDGETPWGPTREHFAADARRVAWWGRLDARYDDYPEHLRVRWLDPTGRTVAETPVERRSRRWIGSVLTLPDPAPPGEWRAELRYATDVVEQRRFTLQASR